jgi:hypothetical protein
VANILQPDRTSRENIHLFLNTIEDEDLKQLLLTNLNQILSIGAGGGDRESFFSILNNLIEERVAELNEN